MMYVTVGLWLPLLVTGAPGVLGATPPEVTA